MPSSLRPLHVVVVGGGIAGVEALLALRTLTRDAFRLTLVCPAEQLHYRPFTVLEPFTSRATRHYDLDEICEDFDVTRHRDALVAVDSQERTIATRDGERIAYDALVLATGAQAGAVLPRACTFLADSDPERLHWVVQELGQMTTRRVAFVVPPGCTWPLPLYELALMTAARVREMGVEHAELTLVTPEDAPLALFQGAGSAAVAERLAQAGIAFVGNSYAHDYDGRTLALTPGERTLEAQRVVALPVLAGPAIDGVPCDADGFVHVDELGRVPGLDDVFAVGDATTFAIKQGGIAAQQADAVAALIARAAGASVPLRSTRPLLRAVLFTGSGPLYLRATIAGGESVASTASGRCPWWPPYKVAARHLAPYLADREESDRTTARRHVRAVPAPGTVPTIIHHDGDPSGIELLGRDRR
ncbi:MAG TPA: FAD-dependent oxidoreductase [Conexibacter sp.]|jgi:sulfide:quinone oxidoreductase|nr:FAD-dependent oxidoreductase [Conexibacter sp.]